MSDCTPGASRPGRPVVPRDCGRAFCGRPWRRTLPGWCDGSAHRSRWSAGAGPWCGTPLTPLYTQGARALALAWTAPVAPARAARAVPHSGAQAGPALRADSGHSETLFSPLAKAQGRFAPGHASPGAQKWGARPMGRGTPRRRWPCAPAPERNDPVSARRHNRTGWQALTDVNTVCTKSYSKMRGVCT